LPSFGFPSTCTVSIPTLSIRSCAHVVSCPADSGFSSVAATPSINLTDLGHPTPLLFPGAYTVLQGYRGNNSFPICFLVRHRPAFILISRYPPRGMPGRSLVRLSFHSNRAEPSTIPRYSHTGMILVPGATVGAISQCVELKKKYCGLYSLQPAPAQLPSTGSGVGTSWSSAIQRNS
jgi:hypothetical protein